MFQKGSGLRDLFRNIGRPIQPILKPILKEAKGIGMAVEADLAQNLLNDLIAGKSTKGSVKARGKEVKGLAAQHTLQALLKKQQNGNGSFTGKQPLTESDLGRSSKTAKRKRSSSKSQPPAKRKRPQSESQPPKRRRTQKGGAILPSKRKCSQTGGFGGLFGLERPAKPKRKRPQTGGFGGFIGTLFKGMKHKKTKKRAGKRKPKKRTGKKRKSRKQTGRGKTGKSRKPRKQTSTRKTGKKRKPRKQSFGTVDDIFS